MLPWFLSVGIATNEASRCNLNSARDAQQTGVDQNYWGASEYTSCGVWIAPSGVSKLLNSVNCVTENLLFVLSMSILANVRSTDRSDAFILPRVMCGVYTP